MTIVNQIGVTGYGEPEAYLEGQVLGRASGWPRAYPVRRHVWTLEFAGDIGVGTVGATWTDELGHTITIDLEIESDGEGGFAVGEDAVTTASDVAELWAAALLAHPDSAGRVESASNSSGTVTISGGVPGRTYSLGSTTSLTAVAQVIEITVADNDEGTYNLEITVGDEDPEDATYEVLPASGDTAEDIRDGLEMAVDALAIDVLADPDGANKLLIESATAGVPISIVLTSPSADLTQTTTVANVSLTLTAAQLVAPIGGLLPFGTPLVLDTIDGVLGVRQIEAGDGAGDIVGFVGRFHTEPRNSPALVDDVPALDPGGMVTPLERVDGSIALRNAGDTDATAGSPVYVVINTAGGDSLGACRADADSGNAVTPTLFRARWLAPTPAGELGLVALR